MPENMTGPPALVTAAHFATATSSDSALVKAMRAAHAHISSAVKTKGDRGVTQHALLELELVLEQPALAVHLLQHLHLRVEQMWKRQIQASPFLIDTTF